MAIQRDPVMKNKTTTKKRVWQNGMMLRKRLGSSWLHWGCFDKLWRWLGGSQMIDAPGLLHHCCYQLFFYFKEPEVKEGRCEILSSRDTVAITAMNSERL